MSVSKSGDSIYDKIRPHLDASDLIRRLGLHEVRTLGSEIRCRPICHESTSGESLQINAHTGRWNCKACQMNGVHGDLFQLVEYVLSGGLAPSKGDVQKTSQGHLEALEWLCQQYGVEWKQREANRDEALDVIHIFSMQAHQHLLQSPDVLAWIEEKWGFDLETVENYGIGFMPSPILPALAAEAERAASKSAFKKSGLGWYTNHGQWVTRFEGRVLFPYLEHGRGQYLIGRATPWTPILDNGASPPKYHKLSVHSENRPWISPSITNDHLYNEAVMASTDEVGVLEGVADCVAISSLGVAVVSPVTISFNAVDLERFVRKCKEQGIKRVWILFDNELSGSGNWAARRTGVQLVQHGLCARVATLPLGDEEKAARDEVRSVLGPEIFSDLERTNPLERKKMIAEAVLDEVQRDWVLEQISMSKIDAAEWSAREGAGAAGKFDAIRKAAVDVIDLEIADIEVDHEEEPSDRVRQFESIVALAAHVEDRLQRESYASRIAKAAGKGVTKAVVASMISSHRREHVVPKRKAEEKASREDHEAIGREMIVLPPEATHTPPAAPLPPGGEANPDAPPAPPAPGELEESDEERYAPARAAVSKAVDAKMPEEQVGGYVAQTILTSMGYTPFRTPDELYLVRANERIAVGIEKWGSSFLERVKVASGLSTKKGSHRPYVDWVVHKLAAVAHRARDVSWSYIERDCVHFPTGDRIGSILKIEPGKVTQTRMSEVRVPCVAGREFLPIEYQDQTSGISTVENLFRWISLSGPDRLLLVYWIVCLPILRRLGTVPIMRIEGGSSSGKTRAVEAVAHLVNGQESGSVPTAAALVSRMSTEMLTIDDNRESTDITQAFLGTLLQATHLGAREKRKQSSDTGTVVERVCGALLMNGIESIHSGKSELASRMILLRTSAEHQVADSPTRNRDLLDAVCCARSAFWSEATRRSAYALSAEEAHGERVGAMISELFGASKIGRLSVYLRAMYFAWVAGQPQEDHQRLLSSLSPVWASAFQNAGTTSLRSLVKEELSVAAVQMVFAFGKEQAERRSGVVQAFHGKYILNESTGDQFLGEMGTSQLARLARQAGKALNAPDSVSKYLRATQLEARLLDGLAFFDQAGIAVKHRQTNSGKYRWHFGIPGRERAPQENADGTPGDTWDGP